MFQNAVKSGPSHISSLHEKVAGIPVLETLYPTFLYETKLLSQIHSGFAKCLVLFHCWFKLEADGVFWVGLLFSNSADSVETKMVMGSTESNFMVLINSPLNKPHYGFTGPSWFWSAT